MRRTKIKTFCSSSLWICLHHMVISRSQNKITDFFMILAWASPFKQLMPLAQHCTNVIQMFCVCCDICITFKWTLFAYPIHPIHLRLSLLPLPYIGLIPSIPVCFENWLSTRPFVQCWANVEDVGTTLYKCYTNVLCLLGLLVSVLPSLGLLFSVLPSFSSLAITFHYLLLSQDQVLFSWQRNP